MDVRQDSNDNDADEGNKDDDADIQYGYRRSWRGTSYEYWGSSLLTLAQIMKQETYYRYAEVAVYNVTYFTAYTPSSSIVCHSPHDNWTMEW
jgi:hypothetical protein